jgi:tetratricopeptide (TPR) repeat protein
MRSIKAITYILGLSLLFTACSGTKKLSNNSSTLLNSYTEGDLSYKSQFRFKYLFFEAQRLKALEDYKKAADLMEQCLAIDPLNAAANFELAQLYIRTEQLESALFYANQAYSLDPNNTWILQSLAQLNLALGNSEAEVKVYKDLVKLEPSNIENQYSLAQVYTRNEQYKKAIQVYNTIENRAGVSEQISVMKERIYIAMGNLDAAAAELQKLIDADPNTIRFRGMLAELLQANDLAERALQVYKEILRIDPAEPRSNIALAEHYRIKNDFAKAFEYLSYCFDDSSFNVDVKFKILVSYFQLTIEDESYLQSLYSLLDKAILRHPLEPSFYALYGDMYYQKNDVSNAYESYSKSLELGATEYLIWNRCLIMGLELQKYDEVIIKGEKAIALNPVQPMLYLFTGLAYSINNEQEKAVLLLNKGVNYVVNNRPLKAEFYNYLGDAYHSLNQHELSDENYEKSLSIIPQNPIVLNNYSYYLSLRASNLDKAERLSKQCNDLMPNEATYQDTYGWILYKLGRFTEAKEWLHKSIVNSHSESAVIVEHYADALYMNGEKIEALKFWKKAITLGGNTPLLLKKASEGILYE